MKMMDTSLFPATSVFSHNEARSADPAPHVSIVHSDNPYRTALATYLRSNGFVVDEFDEPAVAFDTIIGDTPFDTILIDADLPGMAGIGLFLRLINLGVKIPIALFASDYDQIEEDRALKNGAAEYFSKSRRFSIIGQRLRLLAEGARTKTVLAGSSADVISIGALDVKLRCHRASWIGREVPLTVTEFKIVRLLACRSGESISYREIYDMVHGSGFFAGEGPQGYRINVRSLIRKIRDRFRSIDDSFLEIENCPGVGYRWRKAERDDRIGNVAEYMCCRIDSNQPLTNQTIGGRSAVMSRPQASVEG